MCGCAGLILSEVLQAEQKQDLPRSPAFHKAPVTPSTALNAFGSLALWADERLQSTSPAYPKLPRAQACPWA